MTKGRLGATLSLPTTTRNNIIERWDVDFFAQEASDWMRRKGLKLCQSRLKIEIRKNFFTESLLRYCSRLLRALVESPFLEVFRKNV